MPMKKPAATGARDWVAYIDALAANQDASAIQHEMENMTGCELYCMESYSGMPSYLIDRPVMNAMHGTLVNYPIEPVPTMTDLLVAGHIYFYVDDFNHIRKEDFVIEALYDPFTDDLYSILTGYAAQDNLYYYERYVKNPEGGASKLIYVRTESSEPDFDKLQVETVIELPYFPWVGAKWKNDSSFLDKVRVQIIRLECAYRTIGVENVDRRGMSLYIEGVKSTDEIKKAPKILGRNVHTLPPGAKFSAPPSDPTGASLMENEIERLENAIERTTGVISVNQLANLSGVSRIIAERPLIFLCEEIRFLYSKILDDIYNLIKFQSPPVPKVSYRPLWEQDPNERLLLLDKAKENQAISDIEYALELRQLLSLA